MGDRQLFVGAVGMVGQALQPLGERGVVALDEEREAAMASNLLVVLCADREALARRGVAPRGKASKDGKG